MASLFGAATPTGEAFRHCAALAEPSWPLHAYSRRSTTHHADFRDPAAFRPDGEAERGDLDQLQAHLVNAPSSNSWPETTGAIGRPGPHCLLLLVGPHRRYAASSFDRQLVGSLTSAEEQLLSTCRHLQVSCRILQPTLIYGQVGPYSDRNLSRLLQLLPSAALLPAPTGLRRRSRPAAGGGGRPPGSAAPSL